jgi:Transmembrane amino acid transporter protein
MHYNAPRFYRDLQHRSLLRYCIVVTISFGISSILYCCITSLGYSTFGLHCDSFILNNYSPYDPYITICRIAVGISTITAYPIVFIGIRDGICDIFHIPIQQQTPQLMKQMTYTLLVILTIVSIFVHDLGLINAVGGGIVATVIVFIFPTIMLFQHYYTKYSYQPAQSSSSSSFYSTYQHPNVNDTITNNITTNNNNDTVFVSMENHTLLSNKNNKITNIPKVSTPRDHYYYDIYYAYGQMSITILLAIIGVIFGIIGAYTAIVSVK